MSSRYQGRAGKARQQQAVNQIHQSNVGFQNSSPIKGREEDMSQAHSGLFVFKLSDMDFLKRFLITGSMGCFYVNQEQRFQEHFDFLEGVAKADVETGFAAIELIEEISTQGRAAKNDSALFALAILCDSSHVMVRQRAFAAIPKVARTSTHLFMMMGFLKEIRGFGRGLRKAIIGWYLNREPSSLGYQFAKYRNREGWSHRDVLRVVRPTAGQMSPEQQKLIDYVVHPDDVQALGRAAEVSPIIGAYEEMKRLPNNAEGITRGLQLISDHRLPHEVVPNDWKKNVGVWDAILPSMNPEALMRNLGRLTSLGMFATSNSEYIRNIETVKGIMSPDAIRNARLHPLKIFLAIKSYSAGQSFGGLTWTPSPQIKEMLNNAFYDSFAYAPRTGKKIYIGLDVSGSMGSLCYAPGARKDQYGRYDYRSVGISCIEGAAIMARTVAAVESDYHVGAFSHRMIEATHLFQNPSDPIEKTARDAMKIKWGATDLSLPITDAMTNRKFMGQEGFDAFVLFTDNEVNVRRTHPAKLLGDYRGQVGKATRFIVVGMTANRISIADPKDPFMLDIAGFDASIPKLVSEFISD